MSVTTQDDNLLPAPPDRDNTAQWFGDGELVEEEFIDAGEELRRASALVIAFVKAIKAHRLYPTGNPQVTAFLQDLIAPCRRYLAEFGPFTMTISESGLSCSGKALYSNADWKSSIPFLLYNDGLRQLRLLEGLEDWEVQRLVEVIDKRSETNLEEDDLIILLWEQDFAHIDYVAIDDFLDDTGLPIPDSAEQLRSRLLHRQSVAGEGTNDDGESLESAPLAPPSPVSEQTVNDPARYILTPEELQTLQEEIAAEQAPTFILDCAEIIFDILPQVTEADSRQDAVNILLRIADGMITLGDFTRASELLRQVSAAASSDSSGIDLREFLSEAAVPHRIERIGRLLEGADSALIETARPYLLLLPAEAVPRLLQLLKESRSARVRRMLCDVLPIIGRDAVEVFLPELSDARWYVVRNIAYILGCIGDGRATPKLIPLLSHSEPRIRREAAQALGLLGGAQAVAALGKALTDADDVTRCIAACSLGKIGSATALAHLLDAVQSWGFSQKDSGEIKTFFNGIGMTQSDRALPVLEQCLKRRTLFGGKRQEIIRQGAAEALALIGTPRAEGLLTAGRQSKNTAIHHACLQALKMLTR